MSETAAHGAAAPSEGQAEPPFLYDDLPGEPGWKRWEFRDATRFNHFLEPIAVKLEGKMARVRMTPRHEHSNMRNTMHGGALLGFMDVALFAAGRSFGIIGAGGAVTLDLSAQFIGGPVIGRPIEAHVDMLRETGRMLFLRGLVLQDDQPMASFSGTVRKSNPPRA